MNDTTTASAPPKGMAEGGLLSPGFLGLLAMQWLTAINDNIFRWLVIGIGNDFAETSSTITPALVLAAGTISFVLPYLLLAAPAGYLADRFPKRTVIVACKVAEILIMALGVGAIFLGNFWLLLVVLALTGAQSALFSPSRLGAIPESLRPEKISEANGLFGLATISATVIGMALGSWLSVLGGHKGQENLLPAATALVGIAIVGTAVSLVIRHVTAADPTRPFPWRAAVQTWRDLKTLASYQALMRVALGMVFFWSVGSIAQLNIARFAEQGGAVLETDKVPLLIALVAGLGLGSVLAGFLSAGRVELGLLPLGAAGIALGSAFLFTVQGTIIDPEPGVTFSFVAACVLLFLLGASAGIFNVPLEAYMQHRSPRETRGSILAATNFLVFAGILLSSFLFYGLSESPPKGLGLSARSIFLVAGVLTIPVFFYIILIIPQATIRFLVWLASKTIYRIRVYGKENLPPHGGALLTPNHISWLDGVLLLLTSSRPIRMLVWAGNFEHPALRWLANLWGAILIGSKPKQIMAALKEARQALQEGELVCIFPEGGITRSGQIQAFKPGMMKVLEGADAPVVPVYLDGLWGSIFSFDRGKFFWKMPKRWPYPISIYFGQPLENVEDVHQVRQAVQKLGADAVSKRASTTDNVCHDFLRRCKGRKRSMKLVDSTGAELTGGQLLMRTLILRRLLRRHVFGSGEQYVGLLLPPSAGGVVANLAVSLDGRIGVNLNYTLKSDTLAYCIQECGIKHVLTSRKFMEKMQLDLPAELVYLEDFKDKPTLADKAAGVAGAFVTPLGMLERSLGVNKIKPEDVLTVIFTSGSTGKPKGVMLTHGNIASQVEAIDQVIHLRSDDVLTGILPFFHSLGYTVTLWGAMALDIAGAYHFSPLDAKQVGKLVSQHRCTVLLATPTFLRNYLRRCAKEDFAPLDVVVAGAEKLPPELCQAFEEKFGVRPVEGYGTTELSPLVSVNVPPSRSQGNFQVDCKEGTVGRPVPGVSAKTTSIEGDQELGAGEEGMLWISGPNVMKGYLNRPDATGEVIRDGWYRTGDVALIDNDGFIKITGRINRFSKIGGEMVPHIQVEEALNKAIGAGEEDLKAVVTSAPDEKRGERLVVVHTPIDKRPEELCEALQRMGLPNIFVPSTDSFIEVQELPVLGTGKLDLKAIQAIAHEQFGSAT